MVVLGYALETQYELTVQLVEQQRSLRPAATLALGQVRYSPSSSEAPHLPSDSKKLPRSGALGIGRALLRSLSESCIQRMLGHFSAQDLSKAENPA